MKRKLPTIMDVAHRARVAVGTVSNVLNGTTPVSDVKRERVLKAITDLGYSQNMLARGLRRNRSPIVGLCVPFTSISYFAALVDAFEEVASDRGFEIMQVLSRQDPQKELQRVRSLLRYHVGGLMMLPSVEPSAALDLIAASSTPAVLIDRPTNDKRFDQVTYDNAAAMFEAVSHLIALGHRRLLFLVRQRHLSVTLNRIEGLRAAIQQSGKPVAVRIIECGYEESSLMPRLGPELAPDRRPTTIILSNSTLATWTYRVLRSLGIACPEEVSLLAVDDPEWADLVQPSLSVIRPPVRAIALTAWELLIRRMRGEAGEVQRVELRAEVVIRQSVGPPRRRRRGEAPLTTSSFVG